MTDTEHIPSLTSLQKLDSLSVSAPIAVTLFQILTSFYLPPVPYGKLFCTSDISNAGYFFLSKMSNVRRGKGFL